MTWVQPYLADDAGQHVLKYEDGFWQVAPFLKGRPLDRQNYIYEKWRGVVLSRFLIELRERSRAIPFFDPAESFSLKQYICVLVQQIRKYQPALMEQMHPVLGFLEKKFMGVYDSLPVSFCHGDYHPLNMIWAPDDLRAVIDWEFTGYKPEIYDIANLIGCLGMEHPSSLKGDFVLRFISEMKASKIISPLSWEHLLGFIVAMRFPWMSEWLRKADKEMISLETAYMNLLIDRGDELKRTWRLLP